MNGSHEKNIDPTFNFNLDRIYFYIGAANLESLSAPNFQLLRHTPMVLSSVELLSMHPKYPTYNTKGD